MLLSANRSNVRSEYRGAIFQVVHLLCDLSALAVAWQATFEVRVLLNRFMPLVIPRERMDVVAPPLTGILALWLCATLWLKFYRERPDSSIVAGLARVIESVIVVSTASIVLTFFSRHLGADRSRSFILLFVPVSFVFLVASLRLAGWLAPIVERYLNGPKRVAVVGSGQEARTLVENLRHLPPDTVSLRGLILPEAVAAGNSMGGLSSVMAVGAAAGGGLKVLGTTSQLAELINQECLDRIIVAGDCLTEPEVEHCGRVTRRMGVTVSRPIHPSSHDALVTYQVEFGWHFIDVSAPPFTHRQEVIKRAIDVAASLSLLTLLLPLFALIAIVIRITSRGPVFYKAQRVGKGGRYFTFWKFRSMYTDGASRRELKAQNENSGHLFKIRRDPRITPVGRILRRLSLDELPQLLNVLGGDMSLVGPRPLPVEDLDPDGMSREFRQWAEQRALVRPGITGLWQVSGRSDLPFTRMMELDVDYIRHWSLWLDLRILLMTPRAVFSASGAY